MAQKVVALRKKQQLSIGPCKSLPNSPSHSSVSAASIPSVHINQVGNGSGESRGSHMLLCTPSVPSTRHLALDSHNSPGAASGKSRDLSPWCFCPQPRAARCLPRDQASCPNHWLMISRGRGVFLQMLVQSVSDLQGGCWVEQEAEGGASVSVPWLGSSQSGHSCPLSCSPVS